MHSYPLHKQHKLLRLLTMAKRAKKNRIGVFLHFWRLMGNTGGQMAIFIALIFQILFVFFAMIINIGLTVHDKINLQNSVDLAAYYAASKQAEILNLLAHINYQIRQDYKLLAYRQRVVGGFGYTLHPAYLYYTGSLAEAPNLGEGGLLIEQPAVCITHRQWADFQAQGDESLCRSTLNRVAELPRTPIIAGFNPINAVITSLVDNLRQGIAESCNNGAGANWYYAALINYAYKADIARRKDAFKKVAVALTKSQQDMIDVNGDSVLTGAQKTFEKNLTKTNLQSVSLIGLFNSLGTGTGADSVPDWLAEIPINPILLYVDHRGEAGKCTNFIKALTDPNRPAAATNTDPTGALSAYIGEPENNNPFRSSRGFEKNPWYMSYVAFQAVTKPRKPFAPFGASITLKAQAFAKPFGGRIGPWEMSQWPQGSKQSNGGKPIDPLAVPRSDRVQQTGNPAQDQIFIPNYSRFPGDTLGLKSTTAQSFGVSILNGAAGAYGKPSTAHYAGITNISKRNGDPVAFDPTTAGGALHIAEMAAVSPDLFDVTYYSIQPKFNALFLSLGLAVSSNVPGDLGSTPPATPASVAGQFLFAEKAQEVNIQAPGYFYMVRSLDHLLTGWTQDREADYRFPNEKFGICRQRPGINDPATSGDCVIGGRTGYSVKLVSKDYIMSNKHLLGGEEVGPGPIANPLPKAIDNF